MYLDNFDYQEGRLNCTPNLKPAEWCSGKGNLSFPFLTGSKTFFSAILAAVVGHCLFGLSQSPADRGRGNAFVEPGSGPFGVRDTL